MKKLIRVLVGLGLFITIFIVDKVIHLESLIGLPCGWLLPFGLYFSVYVIVGYDVLWKAVCNICHRQFLDENFLMVVATFGAFGLAIYRGICGLPLEGFDEACAVLLFYQIGEWLQQYATGKSRKSIEHLMDLRPDYANLLVDDKIIKIDPDEVNVGSVIIVNPGERVPLDGMVINGSSDLDMKSLTGESLPRVVKSGDEILSGCVNLTAQITIRVTKGFYDSTAAKILDLVENASMKKSKSENFITRFARFYTPIVIVTAVLLMLVCGIVTNDWANSLYRALSFLVVSCPCALVISVPLSFFIALGAASKNGILIKGSNYLEKLNRANVFVFDKTGTLTKGNFVITQVYPSEKREEILRLAAIAEENSSHPIARAIVSTYAQSIDSGYTLTNIAGAGVIANKGNESICCGNAQLLQRQQVEFTPITANGTVVYVARNHAYVGCLIVQDEIKVEAREALTGLAGKTVMLTGDGETVAAAVAKDLGVTSFKANLLPQDKVTAVEALSREENDCTLCFVGDGINDAPVLMRSDVGISMGGIGSDAALEAADIILMHDDLRDILTAKSLAQHTMRIVHQNIFFSILVKIGILTLSALGLTNLWVAIFGDVGVTLLTILNVFRVRCKNKKLNEKKAHHY